MVDWEATSEEEMRVQAVVLLLPAVDPAGGCSYSSAGEGGRAMEMLLQLVAPKSQSPQGHIAVGGFKAPGRHSMAGNWGLGI